MANPQLMKLRRKAIEAHRGFVVSKDLMERAWQDYMNALAELDRIYMKLDQPFESPTSPTLKEMEE